MLEVDGAKDRRGLVPGGYRSGDYAWLGAPLSLIVITIGVRLILFFWPV